MSRKRAAHEALCRLYHDGNLEALSYLGELAEELDGSRRRCILYRLLDDNQARLARWAAREFVLLPVTARIIE